MECTESRSGIAAIVLTTGQTVRAQGYAADIAAAVVGGELLQLADPGDDREKWLLTKHVAWVEDEVEA